MYLTNCPKSVESTLSVETGLSGFHKLIVTALKVKYEDVPPKIYNMDTIKILTRRDFLEL